MPILLLSRSSPVNVVGWMIRASTVGRNPMRVHSTAFQCLQLANSHQFALMQFLSESEYRESASEGVEWVAVKKLIPAQSSQ